MTRRADLLERVRDANPFPSAIEPDWGAVRGSALEEDHRGLASASAAVKPWRASSRVGGVLAGLAACAATAAVVVLALAPSGGSSNFLARAALALTPARGTILYERWTRTIMPEAGNPRRRQAVTFGPDQLWIEGDPPHRYRTVLLPRSGSDEERLGGPRLAYAYGTSIAFAGFAPDRVLGRVQRGTAGKPLELGGTVEAARGKTSPGSLQPTLTFLSSNELLRARMRVVLGPSLPGPHDQIIENGADPVGVLRAAIAEGRAHLAGTTRLNGRTLQRIDISLPQQLPADAPPLPPGHQMPRAEAFAYVEPKTLHPVEIVFGGQIYRFLSYEYLPATAANLKLTDIAAQHPRARVLNTIERHRPAHAPVGRTVHAPSGTTPHAALSSP